MPPPPRVRRPAGARVRGSPASPDAAAGDGPRARATAWPPRRGRRPVRTDRRGSARARPPARLPRGRGTPTPLRRSGRSGANRSRGSAGRGRRPPGQRGERRLTGRQHGVLRCYRTPLSGSGAGPFEVIHVNALSAGTRRLLRHAHTREAAAMPTAEAGCTRSPPPRRRQTRAVLRRSRYPPITRRARRLRTACRTTSGRMQARRSATRWRARAMRSGNRPRTARIRWTSCRRRTPTGCRNWCPSVGRMLQSPFAFFRGSAGIMAADLAHTPATGLHVQACGDCHLMNFGGFATPERNILFDINDYDETLPAPWEWDVKRLVASFVLAARENGFSDAKGRDIAETCARSYRKHLRDFAQMHPLDVWYARVTSDDLLQTLPANERPRVEARIEKAAAQDGSEMDFPKLAGMVGGKVTIRDARPTLLDRYRFVDAAMKVVGVGSVGRRCWVVLTMSESNDPLFLQFKEAVASVLEPYAGESVYPHHGQRVVIGQRLTQPASDMFLGWVTGPGGKQFYVRQLRDAKIKPLVETFDEELMTVYAKACGWVLARAHAKAGDAATIGGYLGGSDQFDEAVAQFAVAYADQAERDYATLKAAVRMGTVEAYTET